MLAQVYSTISEQLNETKALYRIKYILARLKTTTRTPIKLSDKDHQNRNQAKHRTTTGDGVMGKNINVLIVDDHPFFRQGVRFFLDSIDDITVVGEAENGQQALTAVKEQAIDLILLDMQMPGMDGIQTTRALGELNLDLQVLILTSFGQEEQIMQAIASGVSGYCLKDAPPEELIAAIHAVAAGGTYLGKGITAQLLAMSKKPEAKTAKSESEAKVVKLEPTILASDHKEIISVDKTAYQISPDQVEQLTSRELEVLEKIADGLSNKAIAAALFVSEKTVKTHVANIFQKLEVNTRTQAALIFSGRDKIGRIRMERDET